MLSYHVEEEASQVVNTTSHLDKIIIDLLHTAPLNATARLET